MNESATLNVSNTTHDKVDGSLNTENITPRRFRIRYQGESENSIQKKWVKNDAFLSHWMNAYTLTIPEGELFNVRTVRSYIDDIKDEELKKRAKGFLAQELSHGAAHKKFMEVLQQQGYNISIFLKIYSFVSFKILEPLSTRLSKLAFVVAVERINELIGEITLSSKVLDDAPRAAANLYKWHFAEEIEHKSVVFDIYKDVSGNRLMLAYSTLLCYIVNLGFLIFAAISLMIQDGSILNPLTWIRGFRYYFTKEKFFWKITAGCFSLIRSGFHPSQSNNLHYANAVLKSRDITSQ